LSAQPEPVNAPDAPDAAGPYVHAMRAGELLFCSGQLGLHPTTGELVSGDAGAQAGRALENLAAICHTAGTSLAQAIKLTIYTTDMSAFAAINDVYASFFETSPPARVAVGVASLPRNAQVMIDAIVAL
jgi:2-iminobutanoate/2-iminopropanoate deaminase